MNHWAITYLKIARRLQTMKMEETVYVTPITRITRTGRNTFVVSTWTIKYGWTEHEEEHVAV